MISALLILLEFIADWSFGQPAVGQREIVRPVYMRDAEPAIKPMRFPLGYAFLPSMLRFSQCAKACTGPPALQFAEPWS